MRKHSEPIAASSVSNPKDPHSSLPRKKLRITLELPSTSPPSERKQIKSHRSVTSKDRAKCQQSCSHSKEQRTIHDLFDIRQQIGEGGFGKVYLAHCRRDGRKIALKAIPLNNPTLGSSDEVEDSLQREISALVALSTPGHRHVCRLHQQPLRDNSYSYLAMEYIDGGELFEHLCNKGPFSEQDAAKFLRQFAEGLEYIHSRGYVHSDLKPENLMMGSWQKEEACLKVVDFGFSVPDHASIKLSFHGTVAYLPPECLQNTHNGPRHPTAAGDMFAAGVIVYTVLTGTHPFDRTNKAPDSTIATAIATSGNSNEKNNFEYLNTHVFDDRTLGLSPSSISLIRGLLHPDPKRRMTSAQFSKHPWILGQTASTHHLCHHSRLREFWRRRFRAAILEKFWINVTTSTASDPTYGDERCVQRRATRRRSLSSKESEIIFRSMDLDGDGTVSLDELKQAMLGDSSWSVFGEGTKIKQYMIDDIFSSIDDDESGGIDLQEFQRVMNTHMKYGNFDGKTVYGDHDGVRNHHITVTDIDTESLAISNEHVRECIFLKFGAIPLLTSNENEEEEVPKPSRETLRRIFDTMDINKDGVLQLSEAITALREMPGLDEDMISGWADKADADLNGEIDFEEFCTIMMVENMAAKTTLTATE